MKMYVRNVEYKVPFEFCKDCRKFYPYDEECLRAEGCKEAVRLYRKYVRRGKEIDDGERRTDEQQSKG